MLFYSILFSIIEEIAGFVTKLLTFVDGLVAPLVYCCANANFNNLRRRMLSSIRKKRFYLFCSTRPNLTALPREISSSRGTSGSLNKCADEDEGVHKSSTHF